MVQVAARCEVRGTLADDRGVPLTTLDLEAMTDIPSIVFDGAIPVLCAIGWLLCNEYEHTPTILGADSDDGMSTRQNNTRQDKTKQNNTVDSSSIFMNKSDSDSNFNLIPKNRRRGISKWRQAWCEVIVDEPVEVSVVMEAIAKYYKSGEGQSEYFRQPSTLLLDRIWEECPDSWNAKHKPPVDESTTKESFERIFDGKDVL
jgi:hypothetical protein